MYLALTENTVLPIPINPSLQGSSSGLIMASISLTSTPQAISTISSMVIPRYSANNDVVTSTITPLVMYSQSMTTTGTRMYAHCRSQDVGCDCCVYLCTL